MAEIRLAENVGMDVTCFLSGDATEIRGLLPADRLTGDFGRRINEFFAPPTRKIRFLRLSD